MILPGTFPWCSAVGEHLLSAPALGLSPASSRLSVEVLWLVPKDLNGWRTVGCELGKVDGGGQYLEAVADLFLISKSQKAGPMAHPTHLTPRS